MRSNFIAFTILSFVAAFMLSACGQNTVEFDANFDSQQNIKEGDPVFFNDQQVGEVASVNHQNGKTESRIEVLLEEAEQLGSRLAIVKNTLKKNAPLELYSAQSTEQSTLAEEQQIVALDSMLELGTWMVGDVLQSGTDLISESIEGLENYVESEDFQADKKRITEQIENAARSAETMLEKAEKEISEAIEQLQQADDEAAETIEELTDQIVPLVEKLNQEGAEIQRQLSDSVQKWQEDSEGHALGVETLQSLLLSLQELNQALQTQEQEQEHVTEAIPDE